MNTSMTINATAAWLLALYIVAAEEQGVAQEQLQGTTQNDIIKEFLARGTYAFPPAPSMRLIADMIAYTVEHVPKWNPINICSYHLQEAGATPVQEIAYAMSNAIAVLDAARERVATAAESWKQVFGRISFFVNAGVRFIEEHAKLRAMSDPLGGARPRALRRAATRATCASATACRSTRSASPRPSRRTTCSGSCSRRWPSRSAATRARGRSSCRPGTRRSGCRGPGTSSGRCASSRCSPTRPTSSSTPTSSRARR